LLESAELPVVTAVSPQTVTGDSAFTLTVSGSGFYEGSVVRWNGAARPTSYVSSVELRASIAAADLVGQGAASVTVFNAPPGGGTSGAVTVTVQAADPCEQVLSLTIGSSVNGAIATGDCELEDGRIADVYSVTLGTPQTVTFRMTSIDIDAYLELTNAAGTRLLALNDDDAGTLNSRLAVLLPAGSFGLLASSLEGDELGAYSLAAESGPASVTGCAEVWLVPGVQTTQSLLASDCVTSGAFTYYGDRYHIYLEAGQSVTVEMTSTELDPYLLVLDAETLLPLAEDDDSAGSLNARINVLAPQAGVYIIEASSASAQETGSYTLRVP
jgi:hypothetical protein